MAKYHKAKRQTGRNYLQHTTKIEANNPLMQEYFLFTDF